ncbi:hypothetical protein R6Q57_006556 [Mikania cordata]
MAVEASQIALFSSPNNCVFICQADASRYDDRLQSAYRNMKENALPVNTSGVIDVCPATDFMAESGLTSSLPIYRKRSRDSSTLNPPFALPKAPITDPNGLNQRAYEFLSEDMSAQIYKQQFEIDRFINQHNEKVRTEIEEMRNRHSRRLATAYEGIMSRLKTKDDQILKIRLMNRSLEEKVNSISVENQIWRELAQTNEETANALRNNLQQVLAELQIQNQHRLDFAGNCDGESHCGSNFEEDHRLVEVDAGGGYGGRNRRCRICGKGESCVLLLPCRHLCVCSLCVSSVNVCPVCKSTKSAGVHVNMT